MIFAIEGNFAYSFILGVLAAVNPCGFVLLPTYLIFFLGTSEEPNLTTAERLRRALVVSAGISLGFLGIFFIIGVISRLFTQWIELNAKYASLAIGVILLAGGARMLTGWTPKFATPQFGSAQTKTFRYLLELNNFGLSMMLPSAKNPPITITANFGRLIGSNNCPGVIRIVANRAVRLRIFPKPLVFINSRTFQ